MNIRPPCKLHDSLRLPWGGCDVRIESRVPVEVRNELSAAAIT